MKNKRFPIKNKIYIASWLISIQKIPLHRTSLSYPSNFYVKISQYGTSANQNLLQKTYIPQNLYGREM